MYYESRSFYEKRKELKEAIRQLAVSTNPKFYVTAVFNDFSSIEGARRTLKKFHRNIDYRFYGRSFYKTTKDKRTFFFAFPEHLDSNFHYNLLLTPPIPKTNLFLEIANREWIKVCPKGNLLIVPIGTEEVMRMTSYYSTKDCFIERNFENFIISTEFCS